MTFNFWKSRHATAILFVHRHPEIILQATCIPKRMPAQ